MSMHDMSQNQDGGMLIDGPAGPTGTGFTSLETVDPALLKVHVTRLIAADHS